MLKFAQSATRSLPANKSSLIPADVLTDLKSVTVWENNMDYQAGGTLVSPAFFISIITEIRYDGLYNCKPTGL